LDYPTILASIQEELRPFWGQGKVADYIPELARVSPDQFGLSLECSDGRIFELGASTTPFSIQSISKVFTLVMAIQCLSEKVWTRVGVEPSGNPFNSLVQLEYEEGVPRNPFINAGAIVIADMLVSELGAPKEAFLQFMRSITGEVGFSSNEKVAQSEKEHGFRNSAMAYFLKSYGNLKNEVEVVLDFYYFHCALEMNCRQLAKAFMVFANHGCVLQTGEKVLSLSQTKRVNALMQTCGFYDESGEFTFSVGLPGKSGVGGGIAALHPQEFSVSVWSPRLNKKGNSVLGMKALELLTTKTGFSIF
jgi:glutaminase